MPILTHLGILWEAVRCREAPPEWPQSLKAEWIGNIMSMICLQTRAQCLDFTACSCLRCDLNHVLVRGRRVEHQVRIWFAKPDALVKVKFGFWQVQIFRKIMWAQQVPPCVKVQVRVSSFVGITKDCVLPPWGDHWLSRWGLWWWLLSSSSIVWGSPFTCWWVRRLPIQRSVVAYAWLLVSWFLIIGILYWRGSALSAHKWATPGEFTEAFWPVSLWSTSLRSPCLLSVVHLLIITLAPSFKMIAVWNLKRRSWRVLVVTGARWVLSPEAGEFFSLVNNKWDNFCKSAKIFWSLSLWLQ